MNHSDNGLRVTWEFHKTFGHPVHVRTTINDKEMNELRVDLLEEEVQELKDALADGDAVGVLDALTDIQYVLDGAYWAFGMAHVKEAALNRVHASNMSKTGEDGKPIYRQDGKIMKGPRYMPPDLVDLV